MKSRKVKCPVCGEYNWSGKEYCVKCSGELYFNKNQTKDNDLVYKIV